MKKKIFILLCMGMLTLSFCPYQVFADDTVKEETKPEPKKDVIERKYRVNVTTGKVQYRRWNRTKNEWVDPYWIDMN